jgi:uncharacterized protein YceH (UPF0502 family)
MKLEILSELEIRVLGCLLEKEMATPEYYPLTLSALSNACNQKSNRNPVMSCEEESIVRALDDLRNKGFAVKIHLAESRVPKYKHLCGKKLSIDKKEWSLLCELMLRGPQTVGELRSRASRMHPFDSTAAVEETLEELSARDIPLVVRLPREPGRRERRFMHLLGGVPELTEEELALPDELATRQVRAEDERISHLEEEARAIRAELEAMREDLRAFKAQFEE